MTDERRSLEERIGTTVASGSLKSDPLEDAGARERIGALGAATLKLPQGRIPDGLPKWDDRRRLAELLWRLKYGGDRKAGREVALLFGWWLERQEMPFLGPPFVRVQDGKKWRVVASVRTLFCTRVICEWVYDKCPDCGGTGTQGVEPDEAARSVVRYRTCPSCQGSKRPELDHLARALALNLSPRLYEKHWPPRFSFALDAIEGIACAFHWPVARQLRRSE